MIQNKEKEFYDVAIVGAGPSGATMAYYLAKGGIKVPFRLRLRSYAAFSVLPDIHAVVLLLCCC